MTSRAVWGILGAVLAVAWLCPQPVAADGDEAGLQFAVYPSTQKIFPDMTPDGATKAELAGARGEYVAFQVALRSESERTLAVGTDLPDIEIFEALYIETAGTAEWGYPEDSPEYRRPAYPDPLVPVSQVQFEPGVTTALWVRTRVEGDAEGTLVLDNEGIPASITAWDFEMPGRRSLQTAVGLGGKGFAEYYGVEQWSEEYWDIYADYYETLLDYRLTAYRVPYGLQDERGREYLQDERVTTFMMDYYGERERMRALCADLTELGVHNKAYFYNIDEPETAEEFEVARGQVAYLREVCPEFRYLLPFFTGLEDQSTPFDHLADVIDVWGIQTDYYHHGHTLGDRIQEQARERWEEGDEIWLYTALAPRGGWCNILLNHTALEHRLLFWQIFAEEVASGYLFWQSTYWDQVDDPWTDQATVKRLDPALWGDGSLFYPGDDGPVPSLRLELIREGLQDYELLRMAEEAAGREAVMELVGQVTENFTDYTDDPAEFARVRSAVAELLIKARNQE